MNESNYFAVTLPESSKVVTIVARKNTDSIEILHHAVSRTEYFMAAKLKMLYLMRYKLYDTHFRLATQI